MCEFLSGKVTGEIKVVEKGIGHPIFVQIFIAELASTRFCQKSNVLSILLKSALQVITNSNCQIVQSVCCALEHLLVLVLLSVGYHLSLQYFHL